MTPTKTIDRKASLGAVSDHSISADDPYVTYRYIGARIAARVRDFDWNELFFEHNIQAQADAYHTFKSTIGKIPHKATVEEAALANTLIGYYVDTRPASVRDVYFQDQYQRYQQLQRTWSSPSLRIVRLTNSPDFHFAGSRLTGPLQFLEKLLETWKLGHRDAIPLLGLEETDLSYVSDLFSGRATVRGRDVKHRIAYLFRIRKTLSSLFMDVEVENEWLRESHETLNGQIPMDLLLEGSMENLLLVKEYVEVAAGR